MPVRFSMPIAHRVNQDYGPFRNNIVRGRPFRQILTHDIEGEPYSYGLELFIASTGELPTIFSFIDGLLRWKEPKASGESNQLILQIDPNIRKTLLDFPIIEAPPYWITYENVDRESVQETLEALLLEAYNLTKRNHSTNWHPSMKQMLDTTPPVNIKKYLDSKPAVEEAIRELVSRFFYEDADSTIISKLGLPVLSGEKIGRAASYLESDPTPFSESFPLGEKNDPNRAKRLTFRMQDQCEQNINPLYYLYKFMHLTLSSEFQNSLHWKTSILRDSQSTYPDTESYSMPIFSHPLVDIYPELEAPPSQAPLAREKIDHQSRFSLGKLVEFHGYPLSTLFSTPVSISTLEWRYNPMGQLEARTKQGVPVDLSYDDSTLSLVDQIWNTHGETITSICEYLQVPCELVIGVIGTESLRNLDERVIRFEPLKDSDRNLIANSEMNDPAKVELDYDQLVGLSATIHDVIFQPNGISRIDVTLSRKRTWEKDEYKLRKMLIKLLVGQDRLKIIKNSTSSISTNEYTFEVENTKIIGGFAPNNVQEANASFFLPLIVEDSLKRPSEPVTSLEISRNGTLRFLRVSATDHTLEEGTTITVFLNNQATEISTKLPSRSRRIHDIEHSISVVKGDVLSILVHCKGTSGRIHNLFCMLDFLPPKYQEVWLLEGHSTTVLNPWNAEAKIRPTTSDLLWSQVIEIINLTPKSTTKKGPEGVRISPGILQTLVTTADEAVQWLVKRVPEIFSELGLSPLPDTLGGYINDWLLDAKNSILLGITYIRMGYNQHGTYFDLPLVSAAYNSGRLKPVSGSKWGLLYYNDYLGRAAPVFNASVENFESLGPILDPLPLVVF